MVICITVKEVKPRGSDKGEAMIIASLPFREKMFGVRGRREGC
jgi:hypothetical protein